MTTPKQNHEASEPPDSMCAARATYEKALAVLATAAPAPVPVADDTYRTPLTVRVTARAVGREPMLFVEMQYNGSIALRRRAVAASGETLVCALPCGVGGLAVTASAEGCVLTGPAVRVWCGTQANSDAEESGSEDSMVEAPSDVMSDSTLIVETRNGNTTTLRFEPYTVDAAAMEAVLAEVTGEDVRGLLTPTHTDAVFAVVRDAHVSARTLQHVLEFMHAPIPAGGMDADTPEVATDVLPDSWAESEAVRAVLQPLVKAVPTVEVHSDVFNLFTSDNVRQASGEHLWVGVECFRVLSRPAAPAPSVPALETAVGELLQAARARRIMSIEGLNADAARCFTDTAEHESFCENNKMLVTRRADVLTRIEESRMSAQRCVGVTRMLYVLLRAVDNAICANVSSCWHMCVAGKPLRTSLNADAARAQVRHAFCELLLREIVHAQHNEEHAAPSHVATRIAAELRELEDVLKTLPQQARGMASCIARVRFRNALAVLGTAANDAAIAALTEKTPRVCRPDIRRLRVATRMHFTYATRRGDTLPRAENLPRLQLTPPVPAVFHHHALDLYLELLHASHDTYNLSRAAVHFALGVLRDAPVQRKHTITDTDYTSRFARLLRVFRPAVHAFVRFIHDPDRAMPEDVYLHVQNPMLAFLSDKNSVFEDEPRMALNLALATRPCAPAAVHKPLPTRTRGPNKKPLYQKGPRALR